jgi:hypothetical protein
MGRETRVYVICDQLQGQKPTWIDPKPIQDLFIDMPYKTSNIILAKSQEKQLICLLRS